MSIIRSFDISALNDILIQAPGDEHEAELGEKEQEEDEEEEEEDDLYDEDFEEDGDGTAAAAIAASSFPVAAPPARSLIRDNINVEEYVDNGDDDEEEEEEDEDEMEQQQRRRQQQEESSASVSAIARTETAAAAEKEELEEDVNAEDEEEDEDVVVDVDNESSVSGDGDANKVPVVDFSTQARVATVKPTASRTAVVASSGQAREGLLPKELQEYRQTEQQHQQQHHHRQDEECSEEQQPFFFAKSKGKPLHAFSRVQKVHPSDVHGLKNASKTKTEAAASSKLSAGTKGSKGSGKTAVAAAAGGGGGVSASGLVSKESMIQSVVELLEIATQRTQAHLESQHALKEGVVPIKSLTTGLSRKQAMAASGKLFIDGLPDYDQDYEFGLEFLPLSAPNTTTLGTQTQTKTQTLQQQQQSSVDFVSLSSSMKENQAPPPPPTSSSSSSSSSSALSPSLRRSELLAPLSLAERGDLTSACENVYASFLSDLIDVCRSRSEKCTSATEMSMLKVLAQHVTNSFAAKTQLENLQNQMLEAALQASSSNKQSASKR